MRYAKSFKPMSKSLLRIVAVLYIVALSSGCSQEVNVVSMTDVNIAKWKEPITVTLENEASNVIGDLTIVLHVNRLFEAQDVEFEVVSMTADSLRYSESIAAKSVVEWPAVTAQSFDIEIPYRHNVEMRKMGQYSFTITPLTPLKGVESAGISYKREK